MISEKKPHTNEELGDTRKQPQEFEKQPSCATAIEATTT